MNKHYLKQILIPALLLITVGAGAQNLKLTLVKGQKFEVTSKMNVSSTVEAMGQQMESTADNNSVEIIEVKDIRGNETDLTTTTIKLLVNTQAMGQEMNYDSEKKDNSGPMAEELGKTVNKAQNVTIDAAGKIIKQDKESASTGAMAMMAGGSSNGLFLLKQALVGREMKEGNTWFDSTTTQEEKMITKSEGTYTVKSINLAAHSATVLYSGKQTITGVIEQMGMEMNMNTNNKIEGQYDLDLNTGLITGSSVTTTGTLNIEASGMSIPGTTKVTNTVTVKAL